MQPKKMIWGLLLVFTSLLISSGIVSAQENLWLFEVFSNDILLGEPVFVSRVDSPNSNWGPAAPPNVPADNFSVRFTNESFYLAGNYQINLSYDDGVRVSVDDQVVVDAWDSGPGSQIVQFALTAGNHRILVEYREITGDAFLGFGFLQLTTPSDTPIEVEAFPKVTIQVPVRNVRTAPSLNAGILFSVGRGQVYPLIAVNGPNGWLQIQVNNTTGWISGNFVSVENADNVPVIDYEFENLDPVIQEEIGEDRSGPFDSSVRIGTKVLNLREAATTSSRILGQVYRDQVYPVLARNESNGWLQINVNGTVGWISETYTVVTNPENTPVVNTDGLLPEQGDNTTAQIFAGRLNVRNGPGVSFAVIAKVNLGERYTVVGRTEDSGWIQIFIADNVVGWINRGWTSASRSSVANVPVTGPNA